MLKLPAWLWPETGDSLEWEEHLLLPTQAVLGIAGKKLSGLVMRRLVRSKWQYREMTDAEMKDHYADTAW